MATLPRGPQYSLLIKGVQRYATLFQIERRDAVVLRFTDHNASITFEGQVYSPVGGFNSSAEQRNANLKPRNMEFLGVISDDRITLEDLRANRYRDAKVTISTVDWKYPWHGVLDKRIYWITDVTYTEETWDAQVESIVRWFAQRVGRLYTRNCSWRLGDARCGAVDGPVLADLTTSAVVTDVVRQRVVFDSTATAAVANYYAYGELVWTGGNNINLRNDIKRSKTDGRLTLELATPRLIQVGDTFDLYPGCDGLRQTCIDKFDNLDNFGGFPYIPGTDKMLTTPDVPS